MSAAAFILTINLFISAIFAGAFAVVAAYQRSSTGARWLSGAYSFGILNVGLEFILPYLSNSAPVDIALFAAVLLGLGFGVIGLARHYRMKVPWLLLIPFWGAALGAVSATIDWPRDDVLRMFFYQSPYALTMVLGIWVVLKHRRHQALEIALLGVFALSAVNFGTKPLIAMAIGSGGSPQGYITSTYAAISQTSGACLLIANGLCLLLILVRDVMAEMTARSQTDTLSGLLNRRGYEERVGASLAALRRSGLPASMLIADLDNFKQVNDEHGHDIGDRVIVAFADILRQAAGDHFVVARLGGEEFAVFLPGTESAGARLFAESVRTAFSALALPTLPGTLRPTVSIGVAQMDAAETEAEVLRRADNALYEAKREGRDRVRIASGPRDAMPEHPMGRRPQHGTPLG